MTGYLGKKFHKSAKTEHHKSFVERGVDRQEMGYPNNLGVGTRVYGRIDPAVPTHRKVGEVRPLFVTGLWREDGILRKIEVHPFTTKMYNISPGDLLVRTDEMMEAFDSSRPDRLKTSTTIILDNTAHNFPDGKKISDVFKINSDWWSDLLIHRAYSLMYSPSLEVYIQGKIGASLTRTGFVFGHIPDSAIRANIDFIPDHFSASIRRTRVKGFSQQQIDEIPAKVIRFVESQGRVDDFSFPSVAELPTRTHPFHYPKWEKTLPPEPPSPQLP